MTSLASTLLAHVSPLLMAVSLSDTVLPVVSDPPVAELDRLMARYDAPDRPGALVAVVRAGAIELQRAYGAADLAHGVPYTESTRANIGSTAKQFTGFAIALLAREGMLSVDDDIRLYIPELPDFGATMTIRHLLTHTSGYREVINALALGGWRVEDADHLGREEVLRVVERQPRLQNEPGAEWNYNNTGYALLAEVIERRTGQPFARWMEENVFLPLGMTSTVIREDPRQVVPGGARGYAALPGGGFREAPDLGALPGPGGVYTTVADLARWVRQLGSPTVGDTGIIEEMTTPSTLNSGEATTYGYGLVMDRHRGLRRIQHGGGDAGHVSHFAWYPDLDAALIVLVNRAGMDPALPGRIAELFFGEYMTPAATPEAAPNAAATVQVDPALLDDYAGWYELDGVPLVFRFWRDGDALMTRATGQPAFAMDALSDSVFTITSVGARVTFHREAGGAVGSFTLHQGRDIRAVRRDAPPAPDMSGFAGRYYSAEFETYYTVEASTDGLVLHHRRRDSSAVRHDDGDSFSGSFPFIQVRFQRDESGAVTGFRASAVRARDVLFERVPD